MDEMMSTLTLRPRTNSPRIAFVLCGSALCLACVPSWWATRTDEPASSGGIASQSASASTSESTPLTEVPWQTKLAVDVSDAARSIALEVTSLRRLAKDAYVAHVKVVDASGSFVSGLEFEHDQACGSNGNCVDWTIVSPSCKNGRVSSVRERWDRTAPPVAFAVAVDLSGSVAGSLSEIAMGVDAIRQAARADKDQLDLLFFDHRSAIISAEEVDTTTIPGLFEVFGGGTAVWDAAILGLYDLQRRSEERKILFLFTDGGDTSSLRTHEDVAISAQQTDVQVVAVGIGHVDEGQLVELAGTTGGRYYRGLDHDDIDDVFRETALVTQRYYEVTMKCPNLTAGTLVVDSTTVTGGKVRHLTSQQALTVSLGKKVVASVDPMRKIRLMYFGVDEYEVEMTPHTVARLDTVVAEMSLRPDRVAVLEGYADSPGDNRHNEELSERRANAVRRALIKRGAPKKRIRVVAHGETRARSQESDVEYRRVDLRWADPRG